MPLSAIAFKVSNLTPKTQRVSWARPVGQTRLVVTNTGQTPLHLRATGQDMVGRCTFEFRLPHEAIFWAKQTDFTLQPQQSIILTIRLSAPQAAAINLNGPRRNYFTVTVATLTDPPSSQSVLGQLHQRPLIGPTVGLLTLLVGVLLMGSVGYGVILTAFSNDTISQQRDVPPTATTLSEVAWRETAIAQRRAADARRFYGLPYEALFRDMAPIARVEWPLLAEIAYRESRLQPDALGLDDRLGLLQIPLSVWERRAPERGLTDPYEPYSNLLLAAEYLSELRLLCQQAGYEGAHWWLAAYRLEPGSIEALLAREGSWGDIPPPIQQYALDIVRATMGAQRGPGVVASQQRVAYTPPQPSTPHPFWWLNGGARLSRSPLRELYHQVVAGDTVESIAAMYRVAPAEIVTANRLDSGTTLADFGSPAWLIVPQGAVTMLHQQSPTGAVPKDALVGSGVFAWPIRKDISQHYSSRHPALDIRGRRGTPIQAADSGYVLAAGWDGPFGNRVIIEHSTGFQTMYAHMLTISVAAGDNVIKGQPIGQLGSTGNSTGPHLHLEISQHGLRLDPLRFLPN